MAAKPTADLIEEHGGIMLMLLIMGKVASKLEKDETIEQDHLNKIVKFLRNFADKCHHGKEEGILFPELLKLSEDKKVVNELLGDHKTGRDLIRGIGDSIGSYQTGSPDAYHIAVNFREYIHILTKHIEKENEILFPMADKQLSPEMQEVIGAQFVTLEKEVIGVGKHEQYHGWLDELKKIYLV